MKANKYEAFDMATMKRSDIKEAPYNPRVISENARKKLRDFIKNNGLWYPLTVNKRSGTLVSGHQRLSVLDALHRGKDYEMTVSLVDVDEATEIKGNVFMNNPSAQGEWDLDKLLEIKTEHADIDFIGDLGFNPADLDFLFAGREDFTYDEIFQEPAPIRDELEEMTGLKERKREYKDEQRQGNLNGETRAAENTDYSLTFIFPTNEGKRAICRALGLKDSEKYIKGSILYDIESGVYPLGGHQ